MNDRRESKLEARLLTTPPDRPGIMHARLTGTSHCPHPLSPQPGHPHVSGWAGPATPRPAATTATPAARALAAAGHPQQGTESPLEGVTSGEEESPSSGGRKRNKTSGAAGSGAEAAATGGGGGVSGTEPTPEDRSEPHQHADVGTVVHPDDLTPADKIAAMFSAKFKPPPPRPEGAPEPWGSAASEPAWALKQKQQRL